MTDSKLFDVRRMVKSRDQKVLGAATLFFGAFVGRAILASVGAPWTLGIGCLFRAGMSLSWLFVPAKTR